MFDWNVMSISYFVFGLCQAVTGWIAFKFDPQEERSE